MTDKCVIGKNVEEIGRGLKKTMQSASHYVRFLSHFLPTHRTKITQYRYETFIPGNKTSYVLIKITP